MTLLSSLLPSPQEIKEAFPLLEEDKAKIAFFRSTAKNICQKKEEKTALILGPCSIHSREGALEYSSCLEKLIPVLEKNFFVVMRVFTQKSRTSLGWKGFSYDPFLQGKEDLQQGIIETRKLMLELTRKNLPLATELLDPFLFPYFEDLVSWGFIGARTSLSQIHRIMASKAAFPVGFKNTTEGDIEGAIMGAKVASFSHTICDISPIGRLQEIKTLGNPFSHIVLRGSNKNSNFDPISVDQAVSLQKKHHIKAPLLIDCSHGNSQKNEERQREGFTSVITQILEGNGSIMGLMLESYLKKGKQPFSENIDPRISLTDGCLSWEESQELILWANELFSTHLYCSL